MPSMNMIMSYFDTVGLIENLQREFWLGFRMV